MYIKNQVPFFSAYNKLNIRSICKVLNTVCFEKDEVIFEIGDPSDKCFVIVEGEVGLYFDKLFQQLGTVLKSNNILGERGLRN